jgi:hypothetical protein
MTRQDIIDAAQDEFEQTERELEFGEISYEEYEYYMANIEHNLKQDLKDFDSEFDGE